MLVALWRFGVKWTVIILSIPFGLALSVAVIGAQYNGHPLALLGPTGAFFIARAWEPFLGVLTAFYLTYKAPERTLAANQTLSLLGLASIVFSIVSFDQSTLMPSLPALIPTVGTCLLIIAATPGTVVHRILSFPPFGGGRHDFVQCLCMASADARVYLASLV